MERVETGDPCWRVGLAQHAGAEMALLEGREVSGARLRIMVLPAGGSSVLIEIDGIAWPLDPLATHPVALRLPSGAVWPAHLRVAEPARMHVALPVQGQRLLAALRAARWLRVEHQEHLLMLTLPPRSAVDALVALALERRSPQRPALDLAGGG